MRNPPKCAERRRRVKELFGGGGPGRKMGRVWGGEGGKRYRKKPVKKTKLGKREEEHLKKGERRNQKFEKVKGKNSPGR